MKVLIHDGLGIWLCARGLNRGKFHWGESWRGDQLRLTDEQLTALVQGLPLQRRGAARVMTVVVAWHIGGMSQRPELNQLSPD